jgi:acid stress chaperone HdeB
MGYRSPLSVNPGLRTSGIPGPRRPTYSLREKTSEGPVMHRRRLVFLGAALIAATLTGAGAAGAATRDVGTITCGSFLASGQANMAIIITWLRGYHAGKTGVAAYDPKDPYAGRLGYYCGSHRPANLIETSERILSELDRGI